VTNYGAGQAWQGIDGARRRSIHERLRLIGTTAAAFWHDACFIVSLANNLDVPTHLVGHALREIDGILLDVLLPDGVVLPDKYTRAAKVEAITTSLDLEPEVSEFWRDLELQNVTHRRMPFPSADDDQFRALFAKYSDLLEIVTAEFERRFTMWVERLDGFLAIDQPTKAVITRLRNTIPWNTVTLFYFFEKLTGPQWLTPLVDSDFFRSVPSVERDETSGTTRFQRWPQAAYLKRIASIDGVAVSKLVLSLPPNSNPWVTTDLIEIALALPATCRHNLHDRIVGAISDSEALHMSLGALGKLVAVQVRDGFGEQALDLARQILWIDRAVHEPAENEHNETTVRSTSRLGRGEYFEASRGLTNALVDLTPKQPAIELFSDLLSSAISSDLSVGRDNIPNDHSKIWRHVIGGEPSSPHEERHALVGVVRDLATRSAFDEPAEFSAILQYLVYRDWHIFRRIALHVAGQPACLQWEAVESLLMNRSLFESYDTEQEYLQLLRANSRDLSPANVATILQWIDDGPCSMSWQHIQSDDAETTVTRMEVWRLDRLRPIEGQLDASRQTEFVALRDRHQTPDPSVVRPQFTSWTGTRSPIDPTAIAAMPSDELFDYLQDWRPPEVLSFDRPTRAGLGDSLGQALSQDPAHFGVLIRDAVKLYPTYVRAIIEGATSAITAGRELPWDHMLHLIAGVLAIEPTAENESPVGRFTGDTSLAWARMSITTLIETATRKVTSGLTVLRRAEILAAVQLLARDPDPSPSRAAEADPNDPHLMIALNSVRGRALTLAIEHLFWLRQAGIFQSIADCQEVEALVTERLAVEVSPAVLSALGRQFSQITELDTGWAGTIRQPLFNGQHSQAGRDDAWCAYLANHSTEAACSLLTDVYAWHVSQLDPAKETSECDRGLVHHLVELYWSGEAGDIGTGDTIIEELFVRAPAELRSYAIGYIGHSLVQHGRALDEDAGERLKDLWNWRRRAVATTTFDPTFATELQAFQWWFTADNLGTDWLLDNFEWTLRNGATHEHAYQVAKHLAAISNRSPLNVPAVLRCYEYLIAPSAVQILGWDVELYQVAATAIASDNNELRTQAQHLANTLVSRGYLKFRELLH
jgi:hypothetical protein